MDTCRNGHPWTEANTYVNPLTGARYCRACKAVRSVQWYEDEGNRARARTTYRRYCQALKAQALEAYGGPVCRRCRETNLAKLTLDHVNNDGGEHRRAVRTADNGRSAGIGFYAKLRRLGWPNDPPLQVLCLSCNSRKMQRERRAVA